MRRHRFSARRRLLSLERLEHRRLLAADTAFEPGVMPDFDSGWRPPSDWNSGPEVWHTLAAVTAPDFSAGFPEAAATTPWIAAAADGTAGAVVFWIKLSVVDGVSSLHAVPIWARLNPASAHPLVPGTPADGTTSGPVDAATLMESLDGLLFRGPGGANDLPAPPLTFAELADFTPELVEGVQEYFLVVRSSSDFALAAVTTEILLADMPPSESNAGVDEPTIIADSAPSAPTTVGEPSASEAVSAPLAWLQRLRAERPFAAAVDPAIAFPAGDGTAQWLIDAQQGDTGVLVMWVTETTSGDTTSIAMLPVWVRWNPADTVDPGSGLFADGAAGTSSTVVYPGIGVPDADSGSWPRPIESEFGPAQSPQPNGTRSTFLVLRSDSNIEIVLTTVFAVLIQMPAEAFAGMVTGGMVTDGNGPLPFTGFEVGNAASGTLPAFFRGLGQSTVAAPTVRLVRDTGVSDTDRITNRGRLDVDTAPGFRARYSTDGGLTWRKSFRPREGVNTVLVRQEDRSGLASPATSFEFTLDRRRPAAPRVIVAQADAAGAFVSARQGGLVNTRLEPDARVEYSVNKTAWAAEPGINLGLNSIRVRQVDVAGNESRPSVPVAVWQLFAAGEAISAATPVISLRPRLRR